MSRAVIVAVFAAVAPSLIHGQGRGGAEWTTSGYDAQRTASIKNDPRISVQTMQKPGDFGAFKFLWKLKLEYDPKAATALTQPILLDRIIGFRGFKSIAFVGTQSETVHAIDTDFGAPLWKYHINYSASPPPMLNVTTDCPGGLVASLSRPTAVAPAAVGGGGFGGGRGGRSGSGVGEPGMGAVTLATAGQQRGGGAGPNGPGGRGAARGAVPGSAAAAAGNVPGGLPPGARGGGGFGGGPFVPGNDAAYVVGSDGFLHALNVQNGVDLMPSTLFVPANTRVAGLLIANLGEGGSVAYAATTHGCGSQPDGVWAMELGSDKKDVIAFQPGDARIAGSGGLTLGRDGTVYLTTTAGSSPLSNQLIALESKTLKQKATASVAGANFTSSPLLFVQKDKEMIAATGGGKLYLFDSSALASGPVATTAVAGTEKLESAALASWEDAQNTRWIAVPSARGIVTFKLGEANGKLALQPGWTSRDIVSPISPLVVNGVLFTASSGTKAVPSVLYALDAATGKDLWSSLRTITTSVRGGLSAGQGNVYVPGSDGTLYAFGFAIEK
jgi:putative pyrroloquinoline-quinone binding quinoprotein